MATTRTINRLINAVLCDILNVYHPGESIDDADAQTVFHAIQDRIAAWVDDVVIPVTSTESFSMVSGTASYTVGESGTPTKDTPRPDEILYAWVHQGDYDYPVDVITKFQYDRISDKTSSGRPYMVYPEYTAPNITLYLYYVPDSTDTFYFTSIKPMTEPTGYTQDTFADLGMPGYLYDALKWRVSADVAGGFYKPVTDSITMNMQDSYNRMTAKHLSRSMRGAPVELAYTGKGRMSKSDFFAGK